MKLSATVKEAVADVQVEISQEESAEARPGASGPRTRQDGGAEQPDVRQRPAHWVIADLIGKGGHVRTVPIPTWVKSTVDAWTAAAGIMHGTVFRAINKAGRVWGDGMSPKVLWDVVRAAAARAGIDKLAPHDLRRTCARLCHLAGGELDQIQFLLGHVSIQTTERFLGCKQKLRIAVNDRLGIEPDAA
jgi:integrase